MQHQHIQTIVETALCVALAVVLNFIAMRLPINVAGGSISMTMLPIAILALRRGCIAGGAAGTLFGLLDLLIEPFILVPAQVLLDYPVPYLLFGMAVGGFSKLYKNLSIMPPDSTSTDQPRQLAIPALLLVVSLLTGGALRYVCHVFSGVLFFAEYAGGQNVWIYSLVYNVSYLGPSLLASILCVLILMPILDKAVPVR
ncbi:MAG: energy-coupled thiamine transporter ThiT [Coriobacteriales bacterium]|nr:energy-coupled thiamine transporter ThiT [Coriobacteriales bacterium]